jgi:toxin ParE1/3/4
LKIFWTESAKDDLRQIHVYLQKNVSPEYARKVLHEINREVESLKKSPRKGTFVAELEELRMTNCRQLLAGQNRIVFERFDGAVCIHVICHTSMNVHALLTRRILK